MYFKFKTKDKRVQVNASLVYRPWKYRYRLPKTILGIRRPRCKVGDFVGIKRVKWKKDGNCTDLVFTLWPFRVTAMVDDYGAGQYAEA